MTGIDRNRLAQLTEREQRRFVDLHPRSAQASLDSSHFLGRVPMAWMGRWPGAFALTVAEASGSHFVDIDGIDYVDLCLGDTGAMVGHGLPSVRAALSAQADRGLTTMLPSPDAPWVADELARRFGLPVWQLAMTATDANRFVLRYARHVTGRPKIAVFDWCYHGTVDETFAVLDAHGRVVPRPGSIGAAVPPDMTTRVVPFNDLDALARALAHGDVACVLAEPALTNIGIVLPEDGFHDGLRRLCDEAGTLLVIDETHTICAGPGGATREWGLRPDMFVIGKTIGGGIPAAAYGMSEEIAERLGSHVAGDEVDVSGVGGTLTGSALSLAAIRATLSTTLGEQDFATAVPLAVAWQDGVSAAVAAHGLDWCVQRLGCRAEYWFCPPPSNGADAHAVVDEALDAFLHLYALNRGVLMTPFHNMALFSPSHDLDDVARHDEVFGAALAELTSPGP